MAFEREFAEILLEKMELEAEIPRKTPLKNQNFPPFPQWKYQFSAPKRSFSPAYATASYPQTEAKKISQDPKKATSTEPRKKDPIYKIGEIGLDHTSALTTFQSLGAQVESDKISLPILKKEFRRLAKVFHPDQSKIQNSENSFQNLCQSFRQLEEAIAKLSNK